MHDIRTIRDNPQAFDAALVRRGLAPLSASLLAIDETRRAAIHAAEQALARRNAASKDIGAAKKAKDEARASALMAEVGELKTRLPQLEAEAKAAKAQVEVAQAALADAKRALAYTDVTTPISGRASDSYVDVGNLVGADGPTLLTTVVQDEPIYVNFEGNERDVASDDLPVPGPIGTLPAAQ